MLNDLSVLVLIQGNLNSILNDLEKIHSRFLPDFPHLDNEYDQVALIAFPLSIKDRDREITWLLCEDIEDLKYDSFNS
jgi:hypothetical protein